MSEATYDKDSIKNVVMVALGVCFVCAIIVSMAAVQLKPLQVANKELDRNKNILMKNEPNLFNPLVLKNLGLVMMKFIMILNL